MTERRATSAHVAAVATLLLLPGVFWGLPTGKFVNGALVILDGGTPYRDFWTMYAPGSFYAVAGLFALFGREIVAQGIATVVVQGISAGLLFGMLRRLRIGVTVSLAMTAVFVGMLWRTAPELTTYPPALLFLLLAARRMLAHFDGGRPGATFQAGLFCGLAACFKHDVGAYGAIACGVATVLTPLAVGPRRPESWPATLTSLARLVAGSLLPLLPVAAVLARAAGASAGADLFVFPATVFAKVFGEKYPPLLPDFLGPLAAWMRHPASLELGRDALTQAGTWVTSRFPGAVLLAAVAVLLARRRRMDPADLGAALLFTALLPFFWQAAHVQRNTHLHSMAVFSMPLLGMAWRSASRARPALAAAGLVWAAALWIPPAMDAFLAFRALPGSLPLDLPGTRGIRVGPGDWGVYHPIARWIRAHVPEDEPIYVGVQRHDAVVITNQRFYYLARRRGCSPYYELHPGLTDDPDVQREMIRAIETSGVRCAVLWRFGWPDARLDRIRDRRRESFPRLGATLLDEHLATAFEPVAEYGEYVLLWRKGGPAQGPM